MRTRRDAWKDRWEALIEAVMDLRIDPALRGEPAIQGGPASAQAELVDV